MKTTIESGDAFKLRKASFKGKGLQPAAKKTSWDGLRSLVYEGRGGWSHRRHQRPRLIP